ncbi:hypothetical protein Rvan_0353 [Rhodomicrobium vannielii ATCC 17100]|uniref:Magnetosome protein MamS/MamX domain-containing protein n=1 Tax=Rhodomicrobium vannielii (strain ATCC 17100 / DSM 162 / LMG 4299 / NCIMB 10020 / ATH 3.1.1) TaxID=648757 RepID=E3I7M3_RHOVT|nr:hypothetical protein [Rhodomicrobium vannielii]ADP69639.1 hypothetical protein Rvan_0353 [Rhodomicrobium vannielii ATCC 17100]
MSRTAICISATLFGFAAIAAPALAQKGTGEPSGVARQGLKLPVEAMSGTIEAIKIGRCEKTTGRSAEGAHLIVQMPDAKINLHLGPTFALRDELKQLSVGQNISFEAFRTDRMPKGAYIAKSIRAGDKVFALRNDSLRPIWARGRGGGLPVARGGGICWW